MSLVRAAAIVLVLAALLPGPIQFAQAQATPSSQPQPAPIPGPFCGLHTLYAAMRFEGGDVSFASILKPEYLSGSSGSSLAQLERAARENGFYAVPVSHITRQFLRTCRFPVILHVRQNSRSRSPDHYVLFLRWAPEGIRVYDAPNQVETVSYREISSRWDSTGLIVSKTPLSSSTAFAASRRRLVEFGVIGFAICLVPASMFSQKNRHLPPVRSRWGAARIVGGIAARQGAVLVLISVSAGFVFQVWSGGQFLKAGTNAGAAAGEDQPRLLGRQELQRILSDRHVTLVDARGSDSFQLGHLPDAINIPPTASKAERLTALHGIDRSATIVVYCESSACTFADVVADELRFDGFQRVMIYRGGWVEWRQRNRG